jgi:hypothetical protein
MKKALIIGTGLCFIALVTSWVFRLWTPSHEKIHPALPPHSFYSFTLTEANGRIPCLQAEIEGIPFSAKLDIGYDGVLSLPKHLLDQLTYKCDAGTALFGGIRGKKYETPVFTIPRLYIGDLTLIDFPAEESTLEFERDTSLRTKKNINPSDIMARIGWEAFLGTVLLIDLSRSVAICCDSVETLNEKGYPTEQFVSTDLLPSEHLVGFEANIDDRRVKCLLDTGCTLSFIHTHSVESDDASKEPDFRSVDFDNPPPPAMLSIGEHHLGPCTLHKMQLPFGTEAIVGIDFLETQIVCIDFINRKLLLYPAPEEDSLGLQETPSSSAPI